jgi:hypothetical protein
MKRNYAFWSLILLFLYYNIDRWIPLGQWNGQSTWPVNNDQFYLDLIVGVILLGSIYSFRWNFRPGMVLGAALLGLWTYFHLQTWWIPYFQGVTSPRAIAFHAQFLGHTQLLPTYGNHFPPDAEHTFIDIFVFPAFLLCLIDAVRCLFIKPHQPLDSSAKC